MTKPVSLKRINYRFLSPTASVVFASAIRTRMNEKLKGLTYRHLIAWAAYRGVLNMSQSQLSSPEFVLAGETTHIRLTGCGDLKIEFKAPAQFLNTDKKITPDYASEGYFDFLFERQLDAEISLSLDDVIYALDDTESSYGKKTLEAAWDYIVKEPIPEVLTFENPIGSPLMAWPVSPVEELVSKYAPNKTITVLKSLDVLKNIEAIERMGDVVITSLEPPENPKSKVKAKPKPDAFEDYDDEDDADS